jgi:hypothetical protein
LLGALCLGGSGAFRLFDTRVNASIDQRSQSAGFVAGFIRRPVTNVANGAANCLPVKLGFEREGLGSASCRAYKKVRAVGVVQESLLPIGGAGKAPNAVRRKALALHLGVVRQGSV